jgi:leucyl aminopeptidase
MPTDRHLAVTTARKVPAKAPVVARLVASDRLKQAGLDRRRIGKLGFAGEAGQTVTSAGAGDHAVEILVGVGPAADVDLRGLRRAAAAAVKAAGANTSVVIDHAAVTEALEDPAQVTQALAEGALAAAYRFDRYKSGGPASPERITLVGTGNRAEAAGLRRGQVVAEAVAFARDLVNEPGGSLVPAEFAA